MTNCAHEACDMEPCTQPPWCIDDRHDTPCQAWCYACELEGHTKFATTEEAREQFAMPDTWPEDSWSPDDLKDPRP